MKQRPTTFELAQLAALAAPPNARPKDAVRRALELWAEAELELGEHENRREYLLELFRSPDGKKIPIFTDTAEEWAARLASCPADRGDVSHALWNYEFENDEVQRQLFRDKKLTREQRQQLFLGLVKASIHYDMAAPWSASNVPFNYLGRVDGRFIEPQEGFPIHPKNCEIAEEHHRKICRGYGKVLIPAEEVRFVEDVTELLSKPKLKAVHVRWAVEVRQKQLALAKSRVIPASLEQSPADEDQDASIQYKRPHRE
ncbi:MAG: hypothetical protein RLY20_292 [Verrucomicrobiota bacterium]|jgi:hypothetical protein